MLIKTTLRKMKAMTMLCLVLILIGWVHRDTAYAAETDAKYPENNMREVDWTGIELNAELLENEEILFLVTLTEEQKNDFQSAYVLLLGSQAGHSNYYQRLFQSDRAELDDNGLLSVLCKSKAFFALNEQNEVLVGPIAYYYRDADGAILIPTIYGNGKSKAVAALSGDENVRNPVLSEVKQKIFYEYTLDDSILEGPHAIYTSGKSEEGELKKYSSDQKILDANDFVVMGFYIKPTTYDRQNCYIGFDEWTPGDGFTMPVIDLPCKWHMEALDYHGEEGPVYATLQIMDREGIVHSSKLIRIPTESKGTTETTPEEQAEQSVLSAAEENVGVEQQTEGSSAVMIGIIAAILAAIATIVIVSRNRRGAKPDQVQSFQSQPIHRLNNKVDVERNMNSGFSMNQKCSPDRVQFCPVCGAKLSEGVIQCPECGSMMNR